MNLAALEALDVQPGERILEVGFGGGDLLGRLLGGGAGEVIGVDPSNAMVGRARRRYRKESRLRLIEASVTAMPLPDCAVDKACSVNSLYFWANLDAAAWELARVIRPGGKLVLCFQTPQSVRAWPGHRHGFHAWEEEEIASAVEAAGFGDLASTPGSDRKLGEFVCLSAVRAGNERLG
ncbi:MAG TPA: methyltransferase domain-containing protein [Allosphingosinicella sp.]|nr:methyltransferase domain-containing protein [Allosphingosinicella sp.]